MKCHSRWTSRTGAPHTDGKGDSSGRSLLRRHAALPVTRESSLGNGRESVVE